MTAERLFGDRTRRRFHFSLSGLFICVFGIAVGLAEARHIGASWIDGLLAAVAAWGAVGLAQQARDIWRHFQGDESLGEDQRWGVRFAAFWRMAVVALAVGGFVLSQMESVGFVTLPEGPSDFNNTGQLLRSATFFLTLLFMAGRGHAPALPVSPAKRWVEPAALAAGFILGLLVWWDDMMIWFLVHVACEGIAAVSPLRFLEPRAVPSLAAQYKPFVCGSAMAFVLSTLSFTVIWQLPKSSRRWRPTSIALLVILLPACYALDFWLANAGLRRASPFLQGAQEPRPAHVWPTAFLVTAVFATSCSYRWCMSRWDTEIRLSSDWQGGGRYLHEGTTWAILLAAAVAGSVAQGLIEVYRWGFGIASLPAILFDFLLQPKYLLALAILLVACARIFDGLRRRKVLPERGIAALNPKKFAMVWCAVMLATPAAVAALAALSFALWLTPWW